MYVCVCICVCVRMYADICLVVLGGWFEGPGQGSRGLVGSGQEIQELDREARLSGQ